MHPLRVSQSRQRHATEAVERPIGDRDGTRLDLPRDETTV